MTRLREKLPGLGSCDGAAEERKNCDNEVCEKGLNYPLISSKEKSLNVLDSSDLRRLPMNEHKTIFLRHI